MKNLEKAVDQLTAAVPHYSITKPDVSAASVGWHIAHSHLVINSIIGALKKSNPSEYRWKFNFSYLYVTLRGAFPRGRGRAPERVIPREGSDPEVLEDLLSKTRIALAELPGLPPNAYFKHPFFGLLNKNATIRFLEMHTLHHYKIIKDILA